MLKSFTFGVRRIIGHKHFKLKSYFLVVTVLLAATLSVSLLAIPARSALSSSTQATTKPPIVISQIFGGGGNSGASQTNDFVEIFNRGTSPVDLNFWSIQYAAAGSNSFTESTQLSGIISPGQYYLIKGFANGGGTIPLPPADANGAINYNAVSGKVALVDTTTLLVCSTAGSNPLCPTNGYVDLVGYGSDANAYEGSGRTANLSNTTAAIRKNNGCQDTNSNSSDFVTGTPAPRNISSAKSPCGQVQDAPIVAECGSSDPVVAVAGNSEYRFINGGDPDGYVTKAVVSSITPAPTKGTIYLDAIDPAGFQGDGLTAYIRNSPDLSPGSYTAVITFSNTNMPVPQTASCSVNFLMKSKPIVATCGNSNIYVFYEGTELSTPVIGNDPDGHVVSATVTSNPVPANGMFTFSPQDSDAHNLYGNLNASANLSPGEYYVKVTFYNDETPAQSGSCGVTMRILANAPIEPHCEGSGPTNTFQGIATSGTFAAFDDNGQVSSAVIGSVSPVPSAGQITISSLTPAPSTHSWLNGVLTANNQVPAGKYLVKINFANNDSPTPQTASCTIQVSVYKGPEVSQSLSTPRIETGGTTTLSLKITNPNTDNWPFMYHIAFDVNFDANVTTAGNPNITNTCNSGNTQPAAGKISVSEVQLSPAQSCTISIDVTGTTLGTYPLTPGTITYSNLNGPTTTAQAGNPINLSIVNGFVVNSNEDALVDPPVGTLRWTINSANSAGGGRITFSSGLSNGDAIVLSGSLEVGTNISIEADCGSRFTIKGNRLIFQSNNLIQGLQLVAPTGPVLAGTNLTVKCASARIGN